MVVEIRYQQAFRDILVSLLLYYIYIPQSYYSLKAPAHLRFLYSIRLRAPRPLYWLGWLEMYPGMEKWVGPFLAQQLKLSQKQKD